MPPGIPCFSLKAGFTTIPVATLLLGLFVLTGGCESSPGLAPPPPSGFVGPSNRDKVIIFIHGVTASNERSWRNPTTGAYWPELIQNDPELKDYGTYLLGYYSPKFSKASTITEIANRELERLKDEGLLSAGKQVVIIAHSMGGLVAKEMLTQLNRPNREELARLDRIKGVLFLSSPAQGADLGEYASWISMNPQFGNMQPSDLNAFLQQLEDSWQNLLRDRDLLGLTTPRAFCAYETLPTRGMMVVSRVYAASRCDANPTPFDLNHQDIAHPASAAHDPYTWVKARIRDAMSSRDLSRYAMLTRAKATPVADNLPPPSMYKPLVLAATDPGMVGKESLDTLYRIIIPRLQQGERITSLTFDSQPGKEVFFDFAIGEYLKALTVKDSFRYIVFLERGQYRGWMSVQRFQTIFHQNGSAVTKLINQGNYAELQKAGMHVGSIPSTATAFEALEYLNRTKEEGIAVLTPTGALVGIASLQAIQSELLAQAGQPI
ncbi:MAG TPA: alpha/beta fold hydrolase [Nitrospira sp.]